MLEEREEVEAGRRPPGHRRPRPRRRLQHQHHPRRACGSATSCASEGAEAAFSVVGRKGVSALTFRKQERRAAPTSASPTGPAFANAREIGEELTAALRRRGARPGRAGLQPLRLAADPVRPAPDAAAAAAGRGVRRGRRGRGGGRRGDRDREGPQPVALGVRARARGAAGAADSRST